MTVSAEARRHINILEDFTEGKYEVSLGHKFSLGRNLVEWDNPGLGRSFCPEFPTLHVTVCYVLYVDVYMFHVLRC